MLDKRSDSCAKVSHWGKWECVAREGNTRCQRGSSKGRLPGGIQHVLPFEVVAKVLAELRDAKNNAGSLVIKADQKACPDCIQTPGESTGILLYGLPSRRGVFSAVLFSSLELSGVSEVESLGTFVNVHCRQGLTSICCNE